MKSDKRILVAFILNLVFSAVELVGGALTGSIALVSDAVHDFGDGISIGISYFLERKSKRPADEKYTFGYGRFSVIAGAVNSLFLMIGTLFVVYHAVVRLLDPVEIDYNGVMVLAVIGVVVNFAAAYFTHDGASLNQRAVNLHMLEDVFGWIAVLFGAIVMRVTGLKFLDPVMSVVLSLVILISAWKNMKLSCDILLEKVPNGIDIKEIKEKMLAIENVLNVQNICIWSLDGQRNCAVIHMIADGDFQNIKEQTRLLLAGYSIHDTIIEITAL